MNRVVGHMGTMLLALILAMIIWLMAVTQENPIIQEEYPEPIPIEIRNLGEGLQSLQDLSSEAVLVTIRAPQDNRRTLRTNDFNAYVDLDGLGTGEHTATISVEVTHPNVDILSQSEDAITIALDEVLTNTVPVRVEVVDGAAYGYSWQEPLPDPAEVTISGPAAQVEQVVAAEARVNLNNASEQVESREVLQAKDAQDNPITQVRIEPRTAQIVVPVDPWPGRRDVAICFNRDGQPAAGYRLRGVEFTPSTVTLLGDTEVLDEIPCVETEPLSLGNATSDVEQRLTLLLPEGITSQEWKTVSVQARISPIEGGITIQRTPVLREVGEGYIARPSLETVEVILSGPVPRLESLGEEDVRVVLNLSSLVPGTHTIAPIVELPEGIRLESILPQTVEVAITGEAEITPTAGATQVPSPLQSSEEPTHTPTPTNSP